MQKTNAIPLLVSAVIISNLPSAASAQKVYSYYNPVIPAQASVPFEASMRPPAPSYDVNVPTPQQHVIRRAEPAEEAKSDIGGTISGSVGFGTDYSFRGISQTDRAATVQGGVEYEHYSGVYVGLWGSNVNFKDGDQASMELDPYAGYRAEVAENTSIDAGFLYYAYPGASSRLNYDYWEIFLSGEYAIPVGAGSGGFALESIPVGLGFYYSPEFFGETGAAYYLNASVSAPFENGVTIDGSVGKQWFSKNDLAGLPDYIDWSVGLGYSFLEDYEVKVQYVDTNLDKDECGGDNCSGRAIASFTKSF